MNRHTMIFAAMMVGALASAPTASAHAQAGKAAYDEGRRLMSANRPADAEKQFERAVSADDKNALYHHWLGNSIGQQAQDANPLRQGFMARRIKAEWEKAVALDPSLLEAREALITFYLRAPGFMGGSADKAKEQQREIASRSAFRGHLASVPIALAAKDTAAAERAYRAAAAAAPDSIRVPIVLAQSQDAWKRTAAAFATLDTALAKRPNDIALRFQYARLAAIHGEHLARGEQILRALLAEPEWTTENFRPSRAAVHYRLGVTLEKQGRTPDAKAQYERAIALQPDFKLAKDALAALR